MLMVGLVIATQGKSKKGNISVGDSEDDIPRVKQNLDV